jgi:hypothetical protein
VRSTFRKGDVLYAAGYGDPSNRFQVIRGRFLRYATSGQGSGAWDWMAISGMARQGDSGGPIFNEAGELVGVLWGTSPDPSMGIVGTQCGRLHVIMKQALGESGTIVQRTVTKTGPWRHVTREVSFAGPIDAEMERVDPTRILDRSREERLIPICRPRQPVPTPAPQIVVQSDPEVKAMLQTIVDNTTPPLTPVPEENPADELPGWAIALLVLGGLTLGFFLFFVVGKN